MQISGRRSDGVPVSSGWRTDLDTPQRFVPDTAPALVRFLSVAWKSCEVLGNVPRIVLCTTAYLAQVGKPCSLHKQPPAHLSVSLRRRPRRNTLRTSRARAAHPASPPRRWAPRQQRRSGPLTRRRCHRPVSTAFWETALWVRANERHTLITSADSPYSILLSQPI